MQRISTGNRFNTAAVIARQFIAEQSKDLSRPLREFGLKALSLASAERIKRLH